MNAPARNFEMKEAQRQQVPCLAGLSGPSGSGKTFSALRLATGMQSVCGGDIAVIDTESRRALHYADRFKFKHVEFKPPFGSLDYLAVLQHVVTRGVKTVVVDSMSHEHEGIGGYLETHASELERLAGDDKSKRERNNFTAWIKPAQERRKLINGILQLNANFVFCFRAKDKLKIVAGGKPVELGYMPIAGEEFVYEMTLCALLYPGARGVPTWSSQLPGERTMIKLPEQFREMFAGEGRPLDEEAGRLLADWAAGEVTSASDPVAEGKRIAAEGTKAFSAWWNLPATKKQWPRLKPHLDEFKRIANGEVQPAEEDPFGLPPTREEIRAELSGDALDGEIIAEGDAAEAKALCDRLIAGLADMPTERDVNHYAMQIASDLDALDDAERARFATAKAERLKALAPRKR